MQGKGLVKFFLVILFLVVAYQFLLMLPTRSVEANAKDFATQKFGSYAQDNGGWKAFNTQYLDSISNEVVLNLGVKKYTYEELKAQQLALGLDLKGGMSMVLQVDLEDLVKNMSGKSNDPNFEKAISLARSNLENSQDDYITVFQRAFKQVAPNQSLASIFATNPNLRGIINLESTDGEVLTEIRKQAGETVDRTFEKVRKRIDKFGVTQPNVTLDKRVNRIMIELPGIENPERARKLIQSTAKLEFYPVFPYTAVQNQLLNADQNLKSKQLGTAFIQDVDSTAMQFDSSGVRIDQFYNDNKEKLDQQAAAGNDRGPIYNLLIPNANGQYQASIVGITDKKNVKELNKYLQSTEVQNVLPRGAKLLWASKTIKDRETNDYTDDIALHVVNTNVKNSIKLEGDKITEAQADLDGQSGENIVTLDMNSEGAKSWRKLTGENVGKQVAIILDDEVVSAPNVQSEIKSGNTQITGGFSVREAQDLANVLKVGKLPARTEIIEEAIVGPSLGEKNINSGMKSMLVGLALVLLFMVVYYSTGGIISIIALVANLFFIIGSLASMGTVLTLPGIAGIVLTIGMAVDANVIIYERIREELRDGKSMLQAIKDGFQASYSAIIDANVTTILTAIVLNYFGSGPIKGFAVVLIIGVVCSLFAAVLVARLMIDWWTDRGGNMKFYTGMSQNAFANMNIDFIGKSKVALMGSAVFIILGLGSMFTRGFNQGVDFTGGRSYTVKLDKQIDFDKLRTDMTGVFGNKAPLVKQFGTNTQAEITTSYKITETGKEVDGEVLAALIAGVNKYTGKNFTKKQFLEGEGSIQPVLQRSIKIGPTIADDIRSGAFYSTIFALICIFLYILLRFRKWQYGLGAVAALFHDVLIVLSVFSIFNGIFPFAMEIDQAFIAAILTVVGYSINDTVVVFDRIREFFNSYTKKSKEEIINLAVNNTISRTVITSLTTMFVVAMLFVFGGGSIKGFAFALLIGIMVGTYSSVFVATPIVNMFLTEDDVKSVSTKKDKKGKGYTRKVATES